MRISDWSSDVCSSDLQIDEGRTQCDGLHRGLVLGIDLPDIRTFRPTGDGPRRHEHPLGRGNPGDLRLDELTRHELPCPVLQRFADIYGPGIGMDAGIDECYRRPSEFDLTVQIGRA